MTYEEITDINQLSVGDVIEQYFVQKWNKCTITEIPCRNHTAFAAGRTDTFGGNWDYPTHSEHGWNYIAGYPTRRAVTTLQYDPNQQPDEDDDI